MKLSPLTIKMLLDKDKAFVGNTRARGLIERQLPSVENRVHGKLPLHIACWNDSSAETIWYLIEKDISGDTINAIADLKVWRRQSAYCLSAKEDTLPEEQGTVALHLAAEHGKPDVIRYLIQKHHKVQKLDENQSLIQNQKKGIRNAVLKLDRKDKYPLHIACENNANPSVIQMLLNEDLDGTTVGSKDHISCTPIHALCANKDASDETLKILMDAEDHYNHMSTKSLDDRGRSPLYIVVKAGVSEKVLDKLLDPKYFFLKGFNNSTTAELAKMINNLSALRSTLQDHIIEKLTERLCFTIFFLEFYSHVFALGFFLLGSDRLLNETITNLEPTIVSVCLVFFILREFVQISFQHAQYLIIMSNWQELASIGLLISSLQHMFQAADEIRANNFDPNTIPRNLIIATGTMLIIQITYFLRSTFLPFSRFVGGVLLIFKTLIPFFIVSMLLLLAFAYNSLVWGEGENCSTLVKCFLKALNVRLEVLTM